MSNTAIIFFVGITLTVGIWGIILYLLRPDPLPIFIKKNCLFLINENGLSFVITDSSSIDKDLICTVVVDENNGVSEVYNYGKLVAHQPDPEKRPKLVYGYMGPGLTKEELNNIKAVEFDGNKDSLK